MEKDKDLLFEELVNVDSKLKGGEVLVEIVAGGGFIVTGCAHSVDWIYYRIVQDGEGGSRDSCVEGCRYC